MLVSGPRPHLARLHSTCFCVCFVNIISNYLIIRMLVSLILINFLPHLFAPDPTLVRQAVKTFQVHSSEFDVQYLF